MHVVVVVPTTALREQWYGIIDCNGLSLNCEVFVINSAIKANYKCDILILDEIHRCAADTLRLVFEKYNIGIFLD